MKIELKEEKLKLLFPLQIDIDKKGKIVDFDIEFDNYANINLGDSFFDAFQLDFIEGYELLDIHDGQSYVCHLIAKSKSLSSFEAILTSSDKHLGISFFCRTPHPKNGIDNIEAHYILAKIAGESGFLDSGLLHKITESAISNSKGIFISNNDGAIEWANLAFLDITGYTIDEVRGRRPRQLLYGEDSVNVPIDYVDRNIKDGQPFTFENIGYKKNGTTFWFRATVHPLYNSGNETTGRFGLLEDITVARNEYVSLSAKEELWRFAIEGSGEGVCVYDCITGHLQLSGKFKELVGYDANEHIEEHVVSNMLHKEDADEFFNETLPHITKDNPTITLEQRLRNKNGEYRWYLSKGKGLEWDVNGHPGKIIGTLTDIHEKKITEISLKTANNQLLLLINNLDAGIVFENEDNQCLLNNNQVFDILRIPPGNCNAKIIEGNFINQDWVANQFANPDIFKRLTEALCIHKIPSHDNVCTLNDDSVIALCYIPVNVEGINKGHIWKLRDITATYKQEEEIRLLKNHYHKILNEIPSDIFVLSPFGESIFANRFAEKNVDFTIDWQPLVDEISRTRIATQQLNIEYNAAKPIHYCLRTFAPIYNNEGQLEFIVSHSADITELKNIEAQLNTQKDYYTHILDTIPIDIVILDREHRFTYINHNAVKDAERRAFLIGKNLEDYVSIKPENTGLVEKRKHNFKKALEEKVEIRNIEEYKNDDGSSKFVLRVLFPHIIKPDTVDYVLVFGVDVTEQVMNERAAAVQERRNRNLLDIINDGVIRFNKEGQVFLQNPAFMRIMEVATLERSVFNFFDLLNPDQKLLISSQLEVLITTQIPQTGQLTYTLPNSIKHLDYTLTFSSIDDGQYFVARISDITEIANKEKNLQYIINRERELNAQKTQFVRITSHELRTPIAIILANAEILALRSKMSSISGVDLQKNINRITKEVFLMTEILNQLMVISKIEEGKIELNFSEVHLQEFINEIANEFFQPYKDGRHIELILPERTCVLRCDKLLLRNAILNVVNNAFKYSPKSHPPQLTVIETDDDVLITAKDFGIGIPNHEIDNLFQPFFRASNVGSIQGTGLGLMVIEYVMTKHTGSVTFENNQGLGTTFCLSFPKNIIT